MQVVLALAASIGGVGAWLTGARRMWFAGALVICAVIPFTLLAIMQTNKRLLDPGLNRSSETAPRLLRNWGRLHAVRSVLGLSPHSCSCALWCRTDRLRRWCDGFLVGTPTTR